MDYLDDWCQTAHNSKKAAVLVVIMQVRRSRIANYVCNPAKNFSHLVQCIANIMDFRSPDVVYWIDSVHVYGSITL